MHRNRSGMLPPLEIKTNESPRADGTVKFEDDIKLVYNIHESKVKFQKVLSSYMVEKTKVVSVPCLAAPK